MHLAARLAPVLLFLAGIVGTPASAGGLFGKPATLTCPAAEPSELKPYASRGFGTIRGHLGMLDNGNEVLFRNTVVYAVPATTYTKCYFMTNMTKSMKYEMQGSVAAPDGRRAFPPFDAGTKRLLRKTITDNQGRYQLSNLPTGQYYVVAFGETYGDEVIGREGLLGSSVTESRHYHVFLFGDEPPMTIAGASPASATLAVRIVPNVRASWECQDHRGMIATCDNAIDLDQFLGRRSDY